MIILVRVQIFLDQSGKEGYVCLDIHPIRKKIEYSQLLIKENNYGIANWR